VLIRINTLWSDRIDTFLAAFSRAPADRIEREDRLPFSLEGFRSPPRIFSRQLAGTNFSLIDRLAPQKLVDCR
jgi:hypothetical protein